MTVPAQPKLYHIAHVDCLPSIVATSVSGAIGRFCGGRRQAPRSA